ncbi:diacylglycerol/lipid kinase family protein [Algoriphagus sp. PAP.12]|uniref:diacylglycerol/lipid kinase family protein n=1 Tax=Algoriphagus sp. PAP.12 TaxID=2996678 RepID=UPI00227CE4AF|nr:diacylglycerol kinase family protein [Algoriphagus sp. PAP.12]
MSKQALLVYNPKSGDEHIPVEELRERILLNLKGFDLVVFETTGENDSQKIQEKLQEVEPELVLTGGGDGTVKIVAEVLPQEITLAILPMGSANGLAKCLGIDLLEDGLEALRYLKTSPIDGVEINGELCLHLSDFGLNADMIHQFEEEGTRGMFGYIKSSMKQIFKAEPQPFRIKSGGQVWETKSRMLLVANGDRYGTGAIINPKGKMNDGKFEVVAHDVETWEDFLKMTKSMVDGVVPEGNTVQTWSFESCEIENLNHVNFQIDGELKGKPDKISVKILPGRFKMVVSKNELNR